MTGRARNCEKGRWSGTQICYGLERKRSTCPGPMWIMRKMSHFRTSLFTGGNGNFEKRYSLFSATLYGKWKVRHSDWLMKEVTKIELHALLKKKRPSERSINFSCHILLNSASILANKYRSSGWLKGRRQRSALTVWTRKTASLWLYSRPGGKQEEHSVQGQASNFAQRQQLPHHLTWVLRKRIFFVTSHLLHAIALKRCMFSLKFHSIPWHIWGSWKEPLFYLKSSCSSFQLAWTKLCPFSPLIWVTMSFLLSYPPCDD